MTIAPKVHTELHTARMQRSVALQYTEFMDRSRAEPRPVTHSRCPEPHAKGAAVKGGELLADDSG